MVGHPGAGDRPALCHGGQAGLSGLGDCNTRHAALLNVPRTELTPMDRVEPGDPANSWLMRKLDGTEGTFTTKCQSMFCGSQMPLGGPFRTWIMNGALNDCP